MPNVLVRLFYGRRYGRSVQKEMMLAFLARPLAPVRSACLQQYLPLCHVESIEHTSEQCDVCR
jgi:hypothetical protein